MQTNQSRKCGFSPASLHQPPPPSLAVVLGYHTNTPCWATLGVRRGRTWVTHLSKRREFESEDVREDVCVCPCALCILFPSPDLHCFYVTHSSLLWNCVRSENKQDRAALIFKR